MQDRKYDYQSHAHIPSWVTVKIVPYQNSKVIMLKSSKHTDWKDYRAISPTYADDWLDHEILNDKDFLKHLERLNDNT
ncbi:hypothetical protein AIIMSE5_047 [Acinetobacter phage AIIMS-AbE5-RC]|uniref:DUF7300 domain-containing protein n=1 Tax=Acinetobacter phage AIIMS-AbE5-RC TaxID=2981552 RepID=A0A9X9JPT5_9CAUD|nr:hypothetical protein AIIMSE5_047 [Acinetobacter phage AIIMS-AbE5-RC]